MNSTLLRSSHKKALLQPPSTAVCTLHRNEMRTLQTALAIVITKRRLEKFATPSMIHPSNSYPTQLHHHQQQQQQQQHPSTTNRSKHTSFVSPSLNLHEALQKSNGCLYFPTMRPSLNNGEPMETTLTQMNLLNGSNQWKQLPLHQMDWTTHCKHVLSLAWNSVVATSNNNNNNTNTNTHPQGWQGLCLHVACQLSQALTPTTKTKTPSSTKNSNNSSFQSQHKSDSVLVDTRTESSVSYDNDDTNSDRNHHECDATPRSKVVDWIRSQWKCYEIPCPAIHPITGGGCSGLAQKSWFQIWKQILYSQPKTMSELMIPILLDVLLQTQPKNNPFPIHTSTMDYQPNSKIQKTITPQHKNSAKTLTTSTTTCTHLHLSNVHLLFLLENALGMTTREVQEITFHRLSATTTTTHTNCSPETKKTTIQIDTDVNSMDQNLWTTAPTTTPTPTTTPHNNTMGLSVQPNVNSSWYSITDLACDYYHYNYSCGCVVGDDDDIATTTAGDFFLLGHGLAALSEQLFFEIQQ